MELKYNMGIAPDPRSEEEKAKDWKTEDLYGAVVLNWVEKTPDQWRKFVPRQQDGSLSCMAQAGAKACETINKAIWSAHNPYRSRSNYPAGGMWLQDLGEVFRKIGVPVESADPSQFQNESQMNRDITIPSTFKIGGYSFPTHFNHIDDMAEAIELYGHCIGVFHANKEEWTAKPIYNGKEVDFGHGICFVDYFLFNGEKVLLEEDSAGHPNSYDKNGQRLFTADYILRRCSNSMYFIPPTPPIFQFTRTLIFGSRGNDVKELQKLLNRIQNANLTVDGIFGGKTYSSVRYFQKNHALLSDGVVGLKTRAVLNTL